MADFVPAKTIREALDRMENVTRQLPDTRFSYGLVVSIQDTRENWEAKFSDHPRAELFLAKMNETLKEGEGILAEWLKCNRGQFN